MGIWLVLHGSSMACGGDLVRREGLAPIDHLAG
jgi:hypothetical protein